MTERQDSFTAYINIDFVAFEVLTAANMNILGDNDASFNDGSGIANIAWNTTSLSNPYKFAAYASADTTLGASGWTKIALATEEYDTNNNFASSTYTTPIAGFYNFCFAMTVSPLGGTGERYAVSIYKNGVQFKQGAILHSSSTGSIAVVMSADLQLAANNTVEFYGFNSTAGGKTAASGQANTYVSGHLISKT